MLKDYSFVEKLLVTLIVLTLVFIVAAETGLIPKSPPQPADAPVQRKVSKKIHPKTHQDNPQLAGPPLHKLPPLNLHRCLQQVTHKIRHLNLLKILQRNHTKLQPLLQQPPYLDGISQRNRSTPTNMSNKS